MPKAAFTTLGCKVNQYETQRILESFEAAGFEVVPFDAPSDVYVVNTCSVTSQAGAKSRYAVRKAARTNPGAKVVVTGCEAQMSLIKGDGLDGADVVVPNPQKLATLDHLLAAFPSLRPSRTAAPPPPPPGRTRATLKVQDGCDVFCSYCSIPYTRPGMVSRHADEVLAEARGMAEAGYHEAVLTGVLIGAYGPGSGSGGATFEDLVTRLAEESGLARLRISSIEMHQVTRPIIDLARSGQVVPHFHIPLQSGSDRVLADMGRRYRRAEFIDLCHRLRGEVPDLTVTTDIMVGFPTEGDEDFDATLALCEEVRFLKAHVFRFSPRHGTPADAWGDPVPPEDKQRRAVALAQRCDALGRAEARRFLGRTMRVLVESKTHRDGALEGLTDNWLTVRFYGPEHLKRSLQAVRIDEEADGTLYGEWVSSVPTGGLRLTSA
ncbi:MAG: tRNA (N(6)-L-threonylcarbamoyladenosine(37)-C(2))-methylthiotransferase MtaB [Fimbriimonadaceae bacterium]|nr:tRNA (N(6)-L-threonylcarbamoyladenosine(37)-C(2))-methylthiotransferase MtaB [Fimbriimonadaceae bacterium]